MNADYADEISIHEYINGKIKKVKERFLESEVIRAVYKELSERGWRLNDIVHKLSEHPVLFDICRGFSIVKKEDMWYYCVTGSCKYSEELGT